MTSDRGQRMVPGAIIPPPASAPPPPRAHPHTIGFSFAGLTAVTPPLISQMNRDDLIHEIVNYQLSLLQEETLDALKVHVITVRIKALHKRLHEEANFDAAQDVGEPGQYL